MKDMIVELHITTPTGGKQVIPLESCIFGGVMGDGSKAAVGSVIGQMGFDQLMISMIHVSRAFIKMTEENVEAVFGDEAKNLDRERMIVSIQKLAVQCIDEATNVELENDPNENMDLDTHMVKMRWDSRKHKNT